MRDWRVDKETKMDPALIDLIWTLHKQLGSNVPVHLICGLSHRRDQRQSLRKKGGGQAKKSQHILGKAADITFPDVPVKVLRNSALVQDMAASAITRPPAFPSSTSIPAMCACGRASRGSSLRRSSPTADTKYLPTDGKPITPADYKLALANGMVKQDHVRCGDAVRQGRSGSPRPMHRRRSHEAESDAEAETDSAAAGARFLHAPPVIAEDPARAGHPASGQRLFTYASAGGMPRCRSSSQAAQARPPRPCPPIGTPRWLARQRPTTTIPRR